MGRPLVILASRSPRRASLLREAGYVFVQAQPPFEDPPQPAAQGAVTDLVRDLAVRKAQSLLSLEASHQPGPAVIVAADTVVVGPGGELLGQPADRADARRMLRSLIAATHEVVTGVALLDPRTRRAEAFADTARVELGPVADAQLDAYLDSGDWRGKAGAYNLFELQGAWPFRVVGDPTTVVGLPMVRLQAALAGWGNGA